MFFRFSRPNAGYATAHDAANDAWIDEHDTTHSTASSAFVSDVDLAYPVYFTVSARVTWINPMFRRSEGYVTVPNRSTVFRRYFSRSTFGLDVA